MMTPVSERLGPITRSAFIARLRALGFEGPYAASRHACMVYDRYRLIIPSNNEYSPGQHRVMLREVSRVLGRKVTREEWHRL